MINPVGRQVNNMKPPSELLFRRFDKEPQKEGTIAFFMQAGVEKLSSSIIFGRETKRKKKVQIGAVLHDDSMQNCVCPTCRDT